MFRLKYARCVNPPITKPFFITYLTKIWFILTTTWTPQQRIKKLRLTSTSTTSFKKGFDIDINNATTACNRCAWPRHKQHFNKHDTYWPRHEHLNNEWKKLILTTTWTPQQRIKMLRLTSTSTTAFKKGCDIDINNATTACKRCAWPRHKQRFNKYHTYWPRHEHLNNEWKKLRLVCGLYSAVSKQTREIPFLF